MNITMSREKLDTILFAFAIGSLTVGLIAGYLMGKHYGHLQRKQPRRTPAERHTRSHW